MTLSPEGTLMEESWYAPKPILSRLYLPGFRVRDIPLKLQSRYRVTTWANPRKAQDTNKALRNSFFMYTLIFENYTESRRIQGIAFNHYIYSQKKMMYNPFYTPTANPCNRLLY
jgi:hypothetical protein